MADNNDFKNLGNTADYTAQMDAADIQNNKVMAVLAYLSWLVLIPLFAAKDSRFARFHVNQGIILAIIEIAIALVRAILGGIPLIGWIIRLAVGLISIAVLILAIIGIVNAVQGKAKELPIVGSFRIIE